MNSVLNLRVVWEYIRSDWTVYPYKPKVHINDMVLMILCALTAKTQSFAYLFWFRLASVSNPFRLIAKIMHYRLSRSYGVYIPVTTKIGKGFHIWHPCGIVINPAAVIGDYCQVHQFLSIGNTEHGVATIGNHVFIGPHVSIVGPVRIGDNAKIGAGTTVIKDVPTGCTTVGVGNRIVER